MAPRGPAVEAKSSLVAEPSGGWAREIRAVLRKEIASELRTRSGLVTAGLFSMVAVVAVAFAAFGSRVSGSLAAGLLWVTLLFASSVALPRAFVAEEEQGTGDLLRLMARPHAIFWGKALYNLGLTLVTALTLSVLLFGMVGIAVERPLLYLVCLIGGCAALAGAVTLCGALVARAQSRGALAGAVAIPLLLPLVALGVEGMRVALGEGLTTNGWRAAAGLLCYGAVSVVTGPPLFAAVWKS